MKVLSTECGKLRVSHMVSTRCKVAVRRNYFAESLVLEAEPGSNLGSTFYQLCDLGPQTSLLCTLVFSVYEMGIFS